MKELKMISICLLATFLIVFYLLWWSNQTDSHTHNYCLGDNFDDTEPCLLPPNWSPVFMFPFMIIIFCVYLCMKIDNNEVKNE
jgi:hypothetical protein